MQCTSCLTAASKSWIREVSDLQTALTVGALLLTTGSIVGSASWVVFSVRKENALLRLAIDHLTEKVTELKIRGDHQEERHDDHEKRLITLESRKG